MPREYGRVSDHEPATLRCVCNNTERRQGFAYTDSYGVVLDDGEGPDHTGLAEWPPYFDQVYSLCLRCARLYNHLPIILGNSAPVLRLVKLREPQVALALQVRRENLAYRRLHQDP